MPIAYVRKRVHVMKGASLPEDFSYRHGPFVSRLLLVLLTMLIVVPAAKAVTVGIEFVDAPMFSGVLSPIDIGPNLVPYDFFDPTQAFAANGALAGVTQQGLEKRIIDAVRSIFRNAEINQPGSMLNVEIVAGLIPKEEGSVHLIGDAIGDIEFFGKSIQDAVIQEQVFYFNQPPDENRYSVTLADTVARLPTYEPGLTFTTLDEVVNAIAGTTAQEIAHTLGVEDDVPAQPTGGVYPIMASGQTGLPNSARLTERAFLDISNTQQDPITSAVTASVPDILVHHMGVTPTTDFNFDGQVDVLDFNLWLAQWNTDPTDGGVSRGDANADGLVDVLDFNLWLAAFNAQGFAPAVTQNSLFDLSDEVAASVVGLAVVPEPSILGVWGIFAAVFSIRRHCMAKRSELIQS